jgi:hypothetical protein
MVSWVSVITPHRITHLEGTAGQTRTANGIAGVYRVVDTVKLGDTLNNVDALVHEN